MNPTELLHKLYTMMWTRSKTVDDPFYGGEVRMSPGDRKGIPPHVTVKVLDPSGKPRTYFIPVIEVD